MTRSDRDAVHDLLLRYALAVDMRDWESFEDCFVDDAVADYSSELRGIGIDAPPLKGRDAIVRMTIAGLAPFSATQHFMTNIMIRIDGDYAESSAYVIAHHVEEGIEAQSFTLGSIYEDVIVLNGSSWRFASRTLRKIWEQGTLSGTAKRVIAQSAASRS